MKKRFFIWLIPIIWGCCSVMSFNFPGDEYGLFAISSIPGMLIIPIGSLWLDRRRVNRWLWGAFMIAGATLMYDVIYKDIAKNGSLRAYAFFAINIGLYLSIIASLLVTGICSIATDAKKWLARRSNQSGTEGK